MASEAARVASDAAKETPVSMRSSCEPWALNPSLTCSAVAVAAKPSSSLGSTVSATLAAAIEAPHAKADATTGDRDIA